MVASDGRIEGREGQVLEEEEIEEENEGGRRDSMDGRDTKEDDELEVSFSTVENPRRGENEGLKIRVTY